MLTDFDITKQAVNC